MKIRAISLYQPWATAWALQIKRNETRSKLPPAAAIGTPLAVHAALRDNFETLQQWNERRELRDAGRDYVSLPRGKIIAICTLAGVRSAESCAPTAQEQAWGDYSPGRWIWQPANMVMLPEPIPCRGRQFLFWWEVPQSLFAIPAVRDVLGTPF